MYGNFKSRWSWTLSGTQSQTPGLRIGLDLHLVERVSLALQHPLDVPDVLHISLIDS
jgi:hypothetical protein